MKNMISNKDENWKIVRNRVCIRALLIFLGALLMQMLAYMVCMIVMTIHVTVFDKKNVEILQQIAQANTKKGPFLIWVSFVSALLCLIWCGILYKKSSWRVHPFSYKKAFALKNCGILFSTAVGGCTVLTALLSIAGALFPKIFVQYNQVMDHLSADSIGITMFYVLLVGPISEEFIFRGAILDRFHLAFPFWIANTLQAFLFGVYHMNLIQGLYAFLLGILLGMIRYVTGTILANITAHILFNGTSYAISAISAVKGAAAPWITIVLFAVGIVLFLVGTAGLRKEYQKKMLREEQS